MAGNLCNIITFFGIEISTIYESTDIHILGYFQDVAKLPILQKAMESYWKMRSQRALKILALYAKAGIMDATPEMIREKCKTDCPYIPLTAIMDYRVKTTGVPFSEAQKELRRGGEFYVGYDKSLILSPQEAVQLLVKAEGRPVLAHPGQMAKRTDGDPLKAEQILIKLLDELVPLGLTGLECYYPSHTPEQIVSFLSIAKKFNLHITGGTDYHGSLKPEGGKLGSIGISYKEFQNFLS